MYCNVVQEGAETYTFDLGCALIEVIYLLGELVENGGQLVLVFCREYVFPTLVVMTTAHDAVPPRIGTRVLSRGSRL